MSGGNGASYSVEVFVPSTGLSCSFPTLLDQRTGHTMDGLLICGGSYTSNRHTCLSFISGQWVISHTLVEERYLHTSWQTEQGLVLMGGIISPDTSEIVATSGGQGGPSFDMHDSPQDACSITDLTSDSVFLTGLSWTRSTVSRYGVFGWVEDLPSLVVGRMDHGCSSYLKGDGVQVLLVAGGKDNNNRFSSTEVLTMDSPRWTLTTPLPRAMSDLRGVNLAGTLYMTGGNDYVDDNYGGFRDEIMAWLDDEQEWEEAGKMKRAKALHAVSTIQMDDQAMEYCG